jgi:hypothetical protein
VVRIFPATVSGMTDGGSGSMYMMGRLVLGHKTWFGKD